MGVRALRDTHKRAPPCHGKTATKHLGAKNCCALECMDQQSGAVGHLGGCSSPLGLRTPPRGPHGSHRGHKQHSTLHILLFHELFFFLHQACAEQRQGSRVRNLVSASVLQGAVQSPVVTCGPKANLDLCLQYILMHGSAAGTATPKQPGKRESSQLFQLVIGVSSSQ